MPDLAAEAVLIAGGGRAILLQLADPAIGYGVANHSDFASRPLDRLHSTLTFVYAVAFGTPEQRVTVTRRVNRAHGPVHGEAHDNVPAYNAFTPELQLWVAATLYDSALTVHEHILGPLGEELADELYAEYGELGSTLQMPAGLWPENRVAFARYWARRLGELRTDAATRRVAAQLLHPQSGPVMLRAGMPLGRLLTVGFLPERVRELFELPWRPVDQRRFDRVLRLIAAVYPLLPRRIRHWPKNHYLRALQKNMHGSQQR
jgi:uncharacterized protein (DUF2236 family)